MNVNIAGDIDQYSQAPFDIVIFFACLEHMTYEEKLTGLKNAWDLIKPNGHLAIIETPNRLWYHDAHTSHLPFYLWLPERLAFDYRMHSPRIAFTEKLAGSDFEDEGQLLLTRFGRAFSYHELDIALGNALNLNIISTMYTYRWLLRIFSWVKQLTLLKYRYQRYLSKLFPQIPPAYFEEYFNILIRKD